MKKVFFLIILLFFSLYSGAIPVRADKYGIDATAGEAGLPEVADIPSALGNVIGAALSMISVVFFVLMIYAGARWMMARGKEEEEEKAKETMIGAVIGIVIVLLSYALTNFVFKSSSGLQDNIKIENPQVSEEPIVPNPAAAKK